MTPEDWKAALPQDFPAELRQGLSDEQLARQLDLQAWAFDFTGGPLRCWLEIEETGQKTMPAREPQAVNLDWEVDAREGRLVFSVGLTESGRMRELQNQKGKPESVTFRFYWKTGNDSDGKTGGAKALHGGSPLWFGWPPELRLLASETPAANTPRKDEPITLVRAWCNERVPDKEKRRTAAVLLKAAFGPAKPSQPGS